jgi:DNA-binding MarR family transcriptional regulator
MPETVAPSTISPYAQVVEPNEQTEGLAAWVAVLQTHAFMVDALEERLMARNGLPLGWFEVLLRLADAPDGALRMQDLARLAWLSKSGITRLVDRMEAAGLVERRLCATDRRVIYATISETGRKRVQAAIPSHRRDVEQIFARHLSASERRKLLELLQKVLRANGQSTGQACGAPATAAREPLRENAS